MRFGLRNIGDIGQRYSRRVSPLLQPIDSWFLKKLSPLVSPSFSCSVAASLLNHIHQSELIIHTWPRPSLATTLYFCSSLTAKLLERSVYACHICCLESTPVWLLHHYHPCFLVDMFGVFFCFVFFFQFSAWDLFLFFFHLFLLVGG